MERKEHSVPVISASAGSLEFQDQDGNPFKPDNPVNYKLVGEDGDVLKEGTLDGDNYVISLSDVSTRKFKVVVDNYVVAESNGFENLDEEQNEADDEEKESDNEDSDEDGAGGEEDEAGEADDKEDDDSEGETDESKKGSDSDESGVGEDQDDSQDSDTDSSDDAAGESSDSQTSDQNNESGEKAE
jgi:hypothetical protein